MQNATTEGTFDPALPGAAGATISVMNVHLRPPGSPATLVDPATIEAQPWQQLEGFEDVTYKLLWRSGKSVAGILRVATGGQVSPHVHQRSHHHLWVLDGSAEMIGQTVGRGTYLHVPAGAEHGITSPGPEGCTVLYLYLREEGPDRQ